MKMAAEININYFSVIKSSGRFSNRFPLFK